MRYGQTTVVVKKNDYGEIAENLKAKQGSLEKQLTAEVVRIMSDSNAMRMLLTKEQATACGVSQAVLKRFHTHILRMLPTALSFHLSDINSKTGEAVLIVKSNGSAVANGVDPQIVSLARPAGPLRVFNRLAKGFFTFLLRLRLRFESGVVSVADVDTSNSWGLPIMLAVAEEAEQIAVLIHQSIKDGVSNE